MEVMDTSLDKFYKAVSRMGQLMPEDVIGNTAVSVSYRNENTK